MAISWTTMLNREPKKKGLVFYNRRGYIELWTRMVLFFKKKKFIHREFKRTGEIITCSSNMRCYSDAFEWYCFNSFWIEYEKPSGIQEINESSCLVEMGGQGQDRPDHSPKNRKNH